MSALPFGTRGEAVHTQCHRRLDDGGWGAHAMPFHSVEYCLILYMRAHAKAVTGATFTRLRRSRLESERAAGLLTGACGREHGQREFAEMMRLENRGDLLVEHFGIAMGMQ